MSILDKISVDYQTWSIDKKPEMTVDSGFFGFDKDLKAEKKYFLEAIEIIKNSEIKLYAMLPFRLYSKFKDLYTKITGDNGPLRHINIQDDNVKQSASIRITLNIPLCFYDKFSDLMEDKFPTTLPFDCVFYYNEGLWKSYNVQFGFYLIKTCRIRL
jgi:hypothetical protein